MKKFEADVIIVGSGVAGLYCALNLNKKTKVALISKGTLEECDSYLAQGGICVLKDQSDYKAYFEDTMKAGHYVNNKQSVDIMMRGSQKVIKDLIGYGVDFERNSDGSLKYTREGAHSAHRILYHEDITGQEITSKLLAEVKKHENISLYENVTMLDILEENNHVTGIVAMFDKESSLSDYAQSETKEGKLLGALYADKVVWACGGIGGLYQHSTNYPHLTGDALAISLVHGIPLQDPDYVQIHPTTLYTGKKGRAFLISESVRGEGGILLDKNGNRFVNELLPRDVVANAIKEQMVKDGTDYVWLSMEKISKEEITSHFKHIYEECLENGFDCTKEPIPVVPAQHYFMGGVAVDSVSSTSLNGLYACGETSCNGVHGKNRLASNSLLESLVFASRAAHDIENKDLFEVQIENNITEIDWEVYKDTEKLFSRYSRMILKEIQRMKNYHEQLDHEIECRQLDFASA